MSASTAFVFFSLSSSAEAGNASKERIVDLLSKEKELTSLKTKFITDASHEFRTPLSIIKLNIDILNKIINTEKTVERVKDVSFAKDRISGEIKRMTNILDDLLEKGVKNKPRKIVEEEFDIVELSKKLISLVSEKEKRNINLKVFGEPRQINTDKFIMEQVLINLLTNSLKYSRESEIPPEIIVIFETDKLIIRIEDHGMGIPETEIMEVFNPFYRASNVAQHNIEGTGLGLSIVKHIIEAHNQTINVRSTPEVGSTFSFTLKKD